MEIEFDEEKSKINHEKHGYPLHFAELIFLNEHHTVHQAKPDKYTLENRKVAIGEIADKFFATIFVERNSKKRIISFHRIEKRKVNAYRSRKN